MTDMDVSCVNVTISTCCSVRTTDTDRQGAIEAPSVIASLIKR